MKLSSTLLFELAVAAQFVLFFLICAFLFFRKKETRIQVALFLTEFTVRVKNETPKHFKKLIMLALSIGGLGVGILTFEVMFKTIYADFTLPTAIKGMETLFIGIGVAGYAIGKNGVKDMTEIDASIKKFEDQLDSLKK